MGNIISFDGKVSMNDDSLSMSNGLTDVFIDYLLISGSELANSESEKRMISFLAEKQQSIMGMGNVGFDIIEMPWSKETFEQDKVFWLNVIEHASVLSRQKKVWMKLGYEPGKSHIDYALNGFTVLIKRMTLMDIDENNLKEWLAESEPDDPVCCGYPKCPNHGIILSFCGCKLCNDVRKNRDDKHE